MPWNLRPLFFFVCRPLAPSSSSYSALVRISSRRSSTSVPAIHHHLLLHHHHRRRRRLTEKTLSRCAIPSAREICNPKLLTFGSPSAKAWTSGRFLKEETVGSTLSRTRNYSRIFRETSRNVSPYCRLSKEEADTSFTGSSAIFNYFGKPANFAMICNQSLASSPPSSSSSSSSSSSASSSPTNAGKEDTVLPMMRHSSSFLQVSLSEEEKDVVNESFALVVLNHDLPLLTPFLWDKARCRICADGGANRIYDYIPRFLPSEDPFIVRQRYKPDIIKGDLDSIRSEVKDFYAMLGTEILDNSDDQETTDLSKCLSYVKESVDDIGEGNMKLLVLGALGGRLDHEFANLNSLYLFRKLRVILLSDESMTFLLPKGHKHEIKINPSVEGPYCGLLPLSGSSLSTTTSGLKWDLDKTSMEFGGLISTSNMPVSDHVMVSSDTDLVWTISLQHLLARLREHISLRNKGSQCL